MEREIELNDLIERATALIGAGFHLIPLGWGEQEKMPTTKWRHQQPPTIESFSSRILEIGKPMYGIKLNGMVVLDLDQKDDRLRNLLEERFGEAAVIVNTTRGMHLYYADSGIIRPKLRREALPVDVKAGAGAFVVGPCSVRSSGATYQEVRGTLGVTELTPIQDKEARDGASAPRAISRQPPKSPMVEGSKLTRVDGLVAEGERHSHLLKVAAEAVRQCASKEELFVALVKERDAGCAAPSSVPDAEVWGISDWIFSKFREGRLYAESGGFFHVPRHFAKCLRLEPEAASLLMVLLDHHGHSPGKTFGICYNSMKAHRLTALSTRRFSHAVKVLLDVGAIAVAANHQAGRSSRQYRLLSPSSSDDEAA